MKYGSGDQRDLLSAPMEESAAPFSSYVDAHCWPQPDLPPDGVIVSLFSRRFTDINESQFYGLGDGVGAGVVQQAKRCGLIVEFLPFAEESQNRVWELQEQGRLAGVVGFGADIPVSFASVARQRRAPFIAADTWYEDVAIDAVNCDNAGGVRRVMHHLFDLGHQRIGFIGGPLTHPSLAARFKAFQDTMVEAGLFPGRHWCRIRDQVGPDWSKGGDALYDMVQQGLDVTALVCDNDHTAVGVVQACKQLGLDVPGDLSIAGFDDIPKAQESRPGVTTIHVPRFEMGVWAVRRLVQPPEEKEYPVNIRLHTPLVIRGSTGPG